MRRLKLTYGKQIDREMKIVAKQYKLATAEEIKSNFEGVKQRIMPQFQSQKAFRTMSITNESARPRKKTTPKASILSRLRKIRPAVLTIVADTIIILIADGLFMFKDRRFIIDVPKSLMVGGELENS